MKCLCQALMQRSYLRYVFSFQACLWEMTQLDDKSFRLSASCGAGPGSGGKQCHRLCNLASVTCKNSLFLSILADIMRVLQNSRNTFCTRAEGM